MIVIDIYLFGWQETDPSKDTKHTHNSFNHNMIHWIGESKRKRWTITCCCLATCSLSLLACLRMLSILIGKRFSFWLSFTGMREHTEKDENMKYLGVTEWEWKKKTVGDSLAKQRKVSGKDNLAFLSFDFRVFNWKLTWASQLSDPSYWASLEGLEDMRNYASGKLSLKFAV